MSGGGAYPAGPLVVVHVAGGVSGAGAVRPMAGPGPSPCPGLARLRETHLRHAVSLADQVARRAARRAMARAPSGVSPEAAPRAGSRNRSKSWQDDGTGREAVSRGEFSGAASCGAAVRLSRASMLRQFRDQTPGRWRGFLRAHFGSVLEVSMFFGVDEKTGRNWWQGVGRPSVDKALVAQAAHPRAYAAHMLDGLPGAATDCDAGGARGAAE